MTRDGSTQRHQEVQQHREMSAWRIMFSDVFAASHSRQAAPDHV